MEKQNKMGWNVLDLVRPSILNLKSYASAKDEFKNFTENLIFLDANENPYENGLNRYPDPNQTALKKVISEDKNIATENIFLGNGSDEILDLLFRVFCEPRQDAVLINTPTFGMYNVLADINAVTCKEVLLTADFQLDVDEITKTVSNNTKLLFICSPNNPSGNLIKKEDILYLAKTVSAMIVVDEAYIDFSDAKSLLYDIKKYPNLIVTQTLSKAYGLAGIRLGICYANKEVIGILRKVKMPYNINVLTQKKAIEYLEKKVDITTVLTKIKRNKAFLKEALLRVKFVKKIYNSDTNFFLVKVDDANKRYQQFIEKGVVVRNKTNEPLCKNCLRITVGTESEVEQLINTIKILDQ